MPPNNLYNQVMIMPREARKQSRTNIYHIMLRGINRQTIFEDQEDRYFFLAELQRCKEISDFSLYAFCLMPNHVHLLMETNLEPLETVFKRLGSRYAGWYNRKYERVGHLFQDRFRSEVVETEQYFLTVLRYILQNPMKAGLENTPGNYRWSSYLAYEKGTGKITDTQYAIGLTGQRETLVNYLRETNDDTALDIDRYIPWPSDDRAREKMESLTGYASAADFQRMDDALQKKSMIRMYYEGLSIRQISRLTGRNRKTVDRAIKRAVEPLTMENIQPDDVILHEPGSFEYSENIIW